MSCGFSNLKQPFLSKSGSELTYSFADIAPYYRLYLQLMRHWDAILPRQVLRVEPEDLVADFRASVQRMLEFRGLDPQPACFEFYMIERVVHSRSCEQVRQPFNRAGIDQWRRLGS